MKKDQSGLISAYILTFFIAFPIFFAYMILGANVVRLQHEADYTRNVLHGALNVAARELDATQLASGKKVLIMDNAKAKFDEVVAKFKEAETDRTTKYIDKMVLDSSKILEIKAGQRAPNGMTVYTDSLYLESSFIYDVQLPGFGKIMLPVKTPVDVSAIEGIRGMDLLNDGTTPSTGSAGSWF